MFMRNIRVGLVVTREQTMVVRDTLSSMSCLTNVYAREKLATADLFAGARIRNGGQSESDFVACVLQMLEAIGSSWYSSLHPSAIPAMVPDVVGNLAQAKLEVSNGLLEQQVSSSST